MTDINSYEDLYNPETNNYLPEHVAEDYQRHGHKLSYKADAIMETPVTTTLRTVVKEVLD